MLLVRFGLLSGHLLGNSCRSVGHMFSLSFAHLYFLFISHFGFKSGTWLLIAPVPVHCFSITFFININRAYPENTNFETH